MMAPSQQLSSSAMASAPSGYGFQRAPPPPVGPERRGFFRRRQSGGYGSQAGGYGPPTGGYPGASSYTSRRRSLDDPSGADGGAALAADDFDDPSALEEFGGDYGSYLKLLEGDSALGFNPQSDPIGENQDLQSDVFGGGMGMTGKFWNMYKGSASYDSFDTDTDSDVIDKITDDDDDSMAEGSAATSLGSRWRQALKEVEAEQPINGEVEVEDRTTVIAFEPSTSDTTKLYKAMKSALKTGDKVKMESMLDKLDLDLLFKPSLRLNARQGVFGGRREVADNDNEDDPEDDDEEEEGGNEYKSSKQDKRKRKIVIMGDVEASAGLKAQSTEAKADLEIDSITEDFEAFVEKLKNSVPDPIATSKGLSMSFKSLTMYGLSEVKVCGKVKKSFGGKSTWKGYICMPTLAATVDCSTGPGVPFKGKVAEIVRKPKLQLSFTKDEEDGTLHVTSVTTVSSNSLKFVPTYDSSIPLNPWSKVSMSGYMVSRVKKTLPGLMDKIILKIMHVIEKLVKSEIKR